MYSFDEGIASRVPYEAAARVLPQTKRSFSGYVVRQGLAIAMEHNFMVSAAGRENFSRQLTQLVGSIQLTNDLDVHVALLTAPSYQKHINEKYYDNAKTTVQICREYVDLFGIMQKIPNALDILIEDAKNHLKTWGSQPPTFCLCNGSLTTQLTMLPEKTNYVTNGPDGAKRLANGPDLTSYRGLSIIPSRKFSMDAGTAPRDLLRRRVRVAEYYRIPWEEGIESCSFEFYDQGRDSMFRLSWHQLKGMAEIQQDSDQNDEEYDSHETMHEHIHWDTHKQFKIRPVSVNNINSAALDNAVQDDGCMLHSDKKKSNHPKKYKGLYLGVTGTPKDLSKIDYKVDLESLYIKKIQDYSSNKFIHMGMSYDMLQSLKNGDQKIQYQTSEMFGGGIFNDNLLYNEQIHTGFTAICADMKNTVKKTNGSLFANYVIADMFDQLVRMDTSSNGVLALQNSIRDGNGMACVDMLEFHPIFQDDIGIADPSVKDIFSNINTRLQYVKDRLENDKSVQYGNSTRTNIFTKYMQQYDVNGLNMIFFKPDEIKYINIALCVYKYVNDGALNRHTLPSKIEQVLLQLQFWELYKLDNYGEKTTLNKIDIAVQLLSAFSNAVKDGYDEITDETQKTNFVENQSRTINLLIMEALRYTDQSGLFSGDPFGITLNVITNKEGPVNLQMKIIEIIDGKNNIYTKLFDDMSVCSYAISIMEYFNCVNDNNNEMVEVIYKLAECAAHAFNEYDIKIRSWASCVYEYKMSNLHNRTYKNLPENGNYFMSKHFDKISPIMKLDCMTNTQQNGISIEDLHKLDEWGNSHGIHKDGQMFNQFKKAMHTGSTLAIQAINVTNANNNQCIYMPNLHISRCNPLQESDVEKSFSSTNPSMWVIQQMAGMMPLTNKMCRSLMTINTNVRSEEEEIKSIKSKSKYMMAHDLCDKTLSTTNFVKETYNTFLMEEYQKLFNPEHEDNDNEFNTTQKMKTDFIRCLGNAIESNDTYTEELELSISSFHTRQKNHSATFCSSTAAVNYNYIPSFVMREQNNKLTDISGNNSYLNDCINNPLSWNDMPIYQAFTGCIYSDEKSDCNTYVKNIMKEQGLPPNKLLSAHEEMFHESVCSNKEVPIFDVHEKNIRILANGNYVQSHFILPWMRTRKNLNGVTGLGSSMYVISPHTEEISINPLNDCKNQIYHTTSKMIEFSKLAVADCRDPTKLEDIWRHVILVWAARFWKPTMRFVDGGKGMITALTNTNNLTKTVQSTNSQELEMNKTEAETEKEIPESSSNIHKTAYKQSYNSIDFVQPGLPFMHGPEGASVVIYPENNPNIFTGVNVLASDNKSDIFILRPNIEHEMLGIIMGRGGTQELGATFWGQTELSCYDDAQHGIWGMSYKYHERAMVTNERNLIRVYDVAFDGYNGGMDQSFVDWNSAFSIDKFQSQTYDRSTPYHGPSMLVMSLPHNEKQSKITWPNPIVFHQSVQGNPSPDAEKVHGSLPDIEDHIVFNNQKNPALCTPEVQKKYERYMNKLEMTQWASTDSLNRAAGEACIANESSSSPLAFQGSMRRISQSGAVTETHGSGHLGHSYVGMASVREGRGIQNTAMQPIMHRMI